MDHLNSNVALGSKTNKNNEEIDESYESSADDEEDDEPQINVIRVKESESNLKNNTSSNKLSSYKFRLTDDPKENSGSFGV